MAEENKETNRKKVAILGGSFDPPTISHLQLASETLNVCAAIDEVWLIPCGERLDKKLGATPDARLAMVKMAVADFFPPQLPIKVNDIEIKNGELIPTYFLMKRLESEYPDIEFYFILGSDLVPTLHGWDEGLKLITEINYIIFQREDYEVDLEAEHKFPIPKKYIEMRHKLIVGGVSSTELRKRIREAGKPSSKTKETTAAACLNIAGLTTKSVIEYVMNGGAYQ